MYSDFIHPFTQTKLLPCKTHGPPCCLNVEKDHLFKVQTIKLPSSGFLFLYLPMTGNKIANP